MPATAKLCQSAEMSLHLLIPPLNPPIIYLILNRCMVWYRFSRRLHAVWPLTKCFTARRTVLHSSFCLISGSSILIQCQFSPNQVRSSRFRPIEATFLFFSGTYLHYVLR